MKSLKISLAVGTLALLTACGKGSTTYSLLEEGQIFRQSSGTQDAKIDVLWVIDNSGSMASSQQNLANNFPSFIQKFTEKGFDFKLAVTATDAYLALPVWNSYYNQNPRPSYYGGRPQAEIAWFKDGNPDTGPSGYRVITPATPNLQNVFIKNAMQGINGRGDERSLQSMRTALESTGNAGFFRPDGFLAVIILTDEDDFSHDGTAQYERYDRPLHTIASYVSFLDGLTGSTGASRRYSVNTISVKDQACLDSIYNGAQKIGNRVMQLADATGGVKGNLCGNFATELDLISKSIVQLSTQFYLQGDPIPESIKVYIDGVLMPNEGWTYNSAANSIVFQPDYVPPQNSAIKVSFDPKTITF